MKSLVLLSFLFIAGAAKAAPPSLAWSCKMTTASLKGIDAAFIYRGTVLEGRSQISCRNAITGKTVNQTAYLALVSIGVGPQIAIPLFNNTVIKVYNLDVGVADPNQMFGEFSLGEGVSMQLLDNQASLGLSVSASIVNGLGIGGNLNMSLQKGGSIGIGAQVKVSALLVMNKQQYDQRQREIEAQKKKQKELHDQVFNKGGGA